MPTKLLTLLGWPDPAGAAAALDRVRDRRSPKTAGTRPSCAIRPSSTIRTRRPSLRRSPRVSTGTRFSHGARLGDRDRFIVGQPDALHPPCRDVSRAAPLDTLKAWMAFRVADNAAPYLPKPFADARFAFRGKTLLGQAEQRAALEAGDARGRRRRLRRRLRQAASARSTGASASSMPSAISPPKPRRDRGAGRRRQGRLPPPDREARLDGPGDQGGSAEEARHLHDQGRLSRQFARLFEPRHPPRRPGRQRPPRGRRRLAILRRSQQRAGRQGRLGHDARRPTTPTTARCATSSSRPASCRRRSSTPTPTRPSITARSAA